MVTQNCNSRCLMCSFWRSKSSNELTLAELTDVMTQLRKMGVRRICFSGGEPLLRRDLVLVVQEANKLRFEKIQVITNGLSWTEEKARGLLDSGLNRVSLSIDGTGEANDLQRGVKGSFDKAMQTLQLLVHLREGEYPELEVDVGTTLTQITVGHIRPLLEMLKTHGVSCTLQILEYTSFWSRPLTSSISKIQIDDEAIIHSLVNELHQMKGSYPISIIVGHVGLEFVKHYLNHEDPSCFVPDVPCVAGFTSIYVDAHGKVFPGCWAMPPVGDVRKETIEQITSRSTYRETLKRMFYKECPNCPNGYIWSMWYYLPALLKESLWRLKKYYNAWTWSQN